MNLVRDKRVETALYRGGLLTLENPAYRDTLRGLMEILLRDDVGLNDLTTGAMGLEERRAGGTLISQGGGIAAGLPEFAFLLHEHGILVTFERRDGDVIAPGDIVARAEGPEKRLLELERVGLNLLQRMSGIATAAHCLQHRVSQRGRARIIGTRKTPWGLLDKRALHVGGAGTHRLGLGDAILIKNNHLALLATTEEKAVRLAIERAWKARHDAAFIEVEVRGPHAARAAAQTFRELAEQSSEEYPCLLLLDNMTPDQASRIVHMLEQEGLWDHVLLEASGGITEANIEGYAASGVDVISLGALTHSARALDLCLRIS